MRKLFAGAAVLLLLWLGFTNQPEVAINHLIGGEPSSTTTPDCPDHHLDLTPQRSTVRPVDPATSAFAETEADLDASARAMELGVENLTDAELKAALHKLSTQNDPNSTEMRKLVIRRWAEGDPNAAAASATKFAESSIRNDALEQVAIAWTASHPAEAIAWLHTLPEGASKQVATLAAAYEVARVDPPAALGLAIELPSGHDRDALLEHAVSQWAAGDLATAAEWVKQISNTELRETLLAAVAIAAASDNATDAASLIATALTSGEIQGRAAVSITQRWAQSAPQDAAAWVSQFPEMPARDAAVENLVALWAQTDSQATANWLNSLPDGSLRLAAISSFTKCVVQ